MKPLVPMLVVLGSMTMTSLASAQLKQQFACIERREGGRVYIATLFPNGKLEMYIEGREPRWYGTYSFTGDRVSLSVASLHWAESSEALEMHWGIPITFRTPTLNCHTIRHPTGPERAGAVECPTVGGTFSSWVASTTAGVTEDNTFRFYDNHHIRRFRKRIYIAIVSGPLGSDWSSESSDTTTGIYFIEGNRIFMAFGREEEPSERFLSGTVNADGSITFDPPANLTCK